MEPSLQSTFILQVWRVCLKASDKLFRQYPPPTPLRYHKHGHWYKSEIIYLAASENRLPYCNDLGLFSSNLFISNLFRFDSIFYLLSLRLTMYCILQRQFKLATIKLTFSMAGFFLFLIFNEGKPYSISPEVEISIYVV